MNKIFVVVIVLVFAPLSLPSDGAGCLDGCSTVFKKIVSREECIKQAIDYCSKAKLDSNGVKESLEFARQYYDTSSFTPGFEWTRDISKDCVKVSKRQLKIKKKVECLTKPEVMGQVDDVHLDIIKASKRVSDLFEAGFACTLGRSAGSYMHDIGILAAIRKWSNNPERSNESQKMSSSE